MSFPQRRMRRLRRTPALRRLVAETTVTVDDLVAPLFVREGIDEPVMIESLPGVVQHSRTSVRAEVERLLGLGIPAVMLFGVPARQGRRGLGRLGSRPGSCRAPSGTCAPTSATTWC